jgi:hypothetical protein
MIFDINLPPIGTEVGVICCGDAFYRSRSTPQIYDLRDLDNAGDRPRLFQSIRAIADLGVKPRAVDRTHVKITLRLVVQMSRSPV